MFFKWTRKNYHNKYYLLTYSQLLVSNQAPIDTSLWIHMNHPYRRHKRCRTWLFACVRYCVRVSLWEMSNHLAHACCRQYNGEGERHLTTIIFVASTVVALGSRHLDRHLHEVSTTNINTPTNSMWASVRHQTNNNFTHARTHARTHPLARTYTLQPATGRPCVPALPNNSRKLEDASTPIAPFLWITQRFRTTGHISPLRS